MKQCNQANKQENIEDTLRILHAGSDLWRQTLLTNRSGAAPTT